MISTIGSGTISSESVPDPDEGSNLYALHERGDYPHPQPHNSHPQPQSYNSYPQAQPHNSHPSQTQPTLPPILSEPNQSDYIKQAIRTAEDIFRFYTSVSSLPVENENERRSKLLNLRVHSGDLIKKVVSYIGLVRKSQAISDKDERAQLTSILKCVFHLISICEI
jgi:hypothetical protein